MARFLPQLSLVCALTLAGLGACSDDTESKTDAGKDSMVNEAGLHHEAGSDGAIQGDLDSVRSPCQQACQVPADGPCADQTATDCIADCQANIDGVSAQCAECLLQHTGWYGQVCDCDSAEGCCFTVFLPGEDDVTHCHELVDCQDEAYATQCLDYSVGTKLAASCSAVCASSVGDAGL